MKAKINSDKKKDNPARLVQGALSFVSFTPFKYGTFTKLYSMNQSVILTVNVVLQETIR